MDSPRKIGGNITLLLLFCTIFFSCCSSSTQNHHYPLPLISLLSLKASLVDPVGSLHEWQPPPPNFQPPVAVPAVAVWCSWQGIKCDPKTDQIVSLDLSSRNLSGVIQPEIRFLSSSLMHLNLSSNAFDGAFPRTLFTLSQLRTLDISHNNFNSSFPPAVGISNLQFLRLFSAYSNSFSGPLPDDFVRLRFLTHLNLGGSYFQGSIPASYSRFNRLKFLDLAGNSLDGPIPPELGRLTQLERLEIGYNKFNGRIPVEFAMLSNLNYLDMSQNNLSGPLPPELGNLTMLDTLLLFKNHFSGEIPVTYGNIRNLRVLDLSDNSLSGSIPPQLSKLKQLVQLSLMTNQLTGEIPQGLADLQNLDTLLLWNNSFTGILPQRLGCNGKLIKLDVSSNHLTGAIPLNLCLRNTLVKLILFSNNFTSTLPPSVANCSSLARVRIQNNRLNGSIPYGFGLLPNLTYMDLSGNAFSGPIPKDLGNAKGLEYLNMSYNSFESELPDNIWGAPNLQILSAISSKIVGRIPDFVGCTNLYKIELEGNYLSGSIPWDIDHCVKLLSLNFRRNSLSGIIPWEISTLPSITDVDLSHNLLTGTIPSDFDNCSTLENFNVSFNRLTGPVPSSGTIFPNLQPSSFSGNEGLCGGVLLQINPCNKSTTATLSSVNNNDIKKTAGAIVWIIAAAFGVGLLVLIAGTRCFHANYSRGERKDKDQHIAGSGGPWKLTAFQRLNFSADNVLECLSTSDKIIGMGSTGTVYRAEMPGGEVIAVKKLWAMKHLKEIVRRPSSSGVLAEVEVLGNVRHRNIVRLLGCCSNNKDTTMLLYEYMANGSLHDLLHGKKNSFAAGCWMTRYKIALGVAQGICYLHHDCHPLIVHRDLKPSNILLDADMEARVADFGVAKLIQSDESMSVVAGSYGYIAPEYAYTLQVDEKSDIYSYGVVLMEILSGKRSVEAEFGEGNSIVDWVRSKMKSKDGIKDVLDNNAGASCKSVREEMVLLLRVALLCTSRNPAERPSMRDVVSMLQEAQPTRKSPLTLNAAPHNPIKSVVY